MIRELEHSQESIATQIHSIFQDAYNVEAKLIGASEFPPLSRKIRDILSAKTRFFGFFEGQDLAAIVEIEINEKRLDIHSLTVAPNFFRKGIAGKLLSHTLTSFEIDIATVETALANQPAINLYKKHGFVETRIWTPSHGIRKIAMLYKSPYGHL